MNLSDRKHTGRDVGHVVFANTDMTLECLSGRAEDLLDGKLQLRKNYTLRSSYLSINSILQQYYLLLTHNITYCTHRGVISALKRIKGAKIESFMIDTFPVSESLYAAWHWAVVQFPIDIMLYV